MSWSPRKSLSATSILTSTADLKEVEEDTPSDIGLPPSTISWSIWGPDLAFVDIIGAVERLNQSKASSATNLLKAAVPPSGGSTSSRNVIEYRIFIKSRDAKLSSVFKRYKYFKQFDENLRKMLPKSIAMALRKLPPKERLRRILGLSLTRTNSDSEPIPTHQSEMNQVERRKAALRSYLRDVLKVVYLSGSIPAMQFVGQFLQVSNVHALFPSRSNMFELRKLIYVEQNSETWIAHDITSKERIRVAIRRIKFPKTEEKEDGFLMDSEMRSKEWLKNMMQRMHCVKILAEHPNVMALSESYVDKDFFCMVRQFSCGNLVENMTSSFSKSFCENTLADVGNGILSAISFAHSRNVVHLNLNVESVRFASQSPADVQIFGFELPIAEKDFLWEEPASWQIFYTAPELIEEKSSKVAGSISRLKAADMWSIGVILYVLATGSLPFSGESRDKTKRSILNCMYNPAEIAGLSSDFQDLVSKLLVKDPSKRLTARQSMAHPWIKLRNEQNSSRRRVFNEKVIKGLASMRSDIELKRIWSFVRTRNTSIISCSEISKCFRAMDWNQDGKLTIANISKKLEQIGFERNVAIADATYIIRRFDSNQDDIIEIESFIASTPVVSIKTMTGLSPINLEDIISIFHWLDNDKDGFIPRGSLEVYFRENLTVSQHGDAKEISRRGSLESEVDLIVQLVEKADVNGDGLICFEGYLYAMQRLENDADDID